MEIRNKKGSDLVNGDFISDFNKLFLFPTQVQIDLTNKCNLNCIYCYNRYNLIEGSDLSDKGWHNIIDKLITQVKPIYVSFSGGEPLIRANLLFSLTKKLKKAGINVHLNTNSLLIDEKIAKELSELGIDKININIDSLEKQDEIRQGNNLLVTVFKSLNILDKFFPKDKISIACVISKLNYKGILDIAKFVKERNYGELHLLDMIPCEKSSEKFILKKEEWEEFYLDYQKIKYLGIKIKPNHALLFLKELEDKVKIPFCMAGRYKMVITANGKIVPCNYFKEEGFICGDATKDNLLKVWRDSKIMNQFRYFEPKEKQCKNCSISKLCTGGCRAFALKMLNDINRGDPYCILYGLKDEK